MNDHEIKPWMFRAKNEQLYLFLSFFIFTLLAFFFSAVNIYYFIGGLFLALLYIRLQQAQLLGNAMRIHSDQYPELYEIFIKNATRLRIQKASLYITQDPYLQAYAIGVTSCSIVLSSALVEQLSPEEIDFVLGHELGHYKAGHTKISSLFIPLGNTSVFSNLIFGFWQRKAEYSSDRCGLVLTKNIDTAVTALVKITIGGKIYRDFNLRGYVAQIKKSGDFDVRLSEVLAGHPLTTNRIRKLLEFWKESFHKIHEV